MKKAVLKDDTPPDYLRECKKIGRSVRFSFLRPIKKARGIEEAEAIAEFERALLRGDIVQDSERGGLKIYLSK